MWKNYLQDMTEEELPGGFHLARWHGNGKVFISSEKLSLEEALAEVLEYNKRGHAETPYFVWVKGLTPDMLAWFKDPIVSEPL